MGYTALSCCVCDGFMDLNGILNIHYFLLYYNVNTFLFVDDKNTLFIVNGEMKVYIVDRSLL